MRLMLAAGTAALIAGCSDASRFSADPFADPFDRSPTHTTRSSRSVDRAPTGAIASAPNSAPIQARPLAAPTKAAPQANAGARPVPAPQPQAAAPAGAYNHWSAEGGTPITVAGGETPAIIANRYGVPTDALLHVNGFSSAQQVQPGARLVIPVYRATAVAPKPAPPAHVATEERPVPKPVHKVEAKPAPSKPAKPEKAAKSEEDDDDARATKKAAGKRVEAPTPKPPHLAKAEKREEEEKAAAVAKAKTLKQTAKADEDKPVAKPKAHVGKVAKDDDEEDKSVVASKARPGKTHVAVKAEEEREPKTVVKSKPARMARVEERTEEVQRAPQSKARVARAEPAPVEAPAPKIQEKREPVKTAAAEAPAVETAKVDRSTTTASVGPVEEDKPSDSAHPEFRWPARGRIIQGFASGGNDGINIAVPEGTSVKAAEGGTVVYAGNELKGYGNLVLIRHPNGFVSAYAHNGEVSVKRGDHVTRGQAIAKSGQSGNVASPQLHFELRKGSTPVDPTSYLAGL